MSAGQGSAKESIQTVAKMLTATEPNDTSRLLSAIRVLIVIALDGACDEEPSTKEELIAELKSDLESGKPLVRTRNHAEIPPTEQTIDEAISRVSRAYLESCTNTQMALVSDVLCSVKCELFDVQDSKGGKHEVPSSG